MARPPVRLEGRIPIAAPPADVWALLVQPLALASCVPGVTRARQVDERTFEGGIAAAVGPLNGDFAFTSVITRADFPDNLEVTLDGLDSVTKSRLEAAVTAAVEEPAPGASMLVYRAEVRVKGRLAILGEMVLRATATVLIGQVTRCLRDRLEAGAAPGA